ncbi:tyrosine phosphatase-like protein [Kalaharituber pfeilii]|nr:tyrosine phosphatase-like protein [Kalaharituber pfeilii]
MSATKHYLTAYSAVNAALWGTVFVRAVSALRNHGPAEVYDNVGEFTKWTQTIIVLDFVHVLFGFVRTSLLTVLFQSFSRLFLVWAICPLSPSATVSPFYTSMLVSWSIAEVVRYTYYVLSALSPTGTPPPWLVWARYNFFFVLYITGASSEWVCMWLRWRELGGWDGLKGARGLLQGGGIGEGVKGREASTVVYWIVTVMLVAWPVFFPNQYLHMMRLRRKMMRGKKKA